MRRRRSRVYWIYWDARDGTLRALKSLPFWVFEVTLTAFISAAVGQCFGWFWGVIVAWLFLAAAITFVFVFKAVVSGYRQLFFIYARDAVSYITHESEFIRRRATLGGALMMQYASEALQEEMRMGRIRSIGRRPRSIHSFVPIPASEWKHLSFDQFEMRKIHGERGKTECMVLVDEYQTYDDVMARRSDIVKQFPK